MSNGLDVLVVGGGPAGSATALRLARRGLRVGLFERGRFEQARVGESLAPAAIPLLRELEVWDAFQAVPHVRSYGVISVWGSAEPAAHSYMSNIYGCGYHVERSAFDRVLAEAAVAAGAELSLGTTLQRCAWTGDGFDVVATRGAKRHQLRARVVIDATGRSAHVARQLGAERLLFDRAVAVAARWDRRDESHLLVEATPSGWFYSAPISERALSVMLMTDADLCGGTARRFGTTPRELRSIAKALGLAAGGAGSTANASNWSAESSDAPVTSPGSLASECLTLALAEAQHTRGRIRGARPSMFARVHCAQSQRLHHARARRREAGTYLAVGDAALAVDPIAGSGVVRALRSASAAADTVCEVLEAPDLQYDLLEEYDAAYDDECTKYLVERAHYYASESRFDSPYWRRRAHVAKLLSATG